MRTTTIVTILILAILSGCNTPEEKAAIAKLEVKIKTVDSIIELYKNLPIDSLSHAYKTKLNPTVEFIKKNMTADVKINHADIITVTDFTDYVKGLKKIMPLATTTASSLFKIKHQFETLRKDLSKGLIPADSIKHYLDTEIQNFTLLYAEVDKVLNLNKLGIINREKELKTDSILNQLFPETDSIK